MYVCLFLYEDVCMHKNINIYIYMYVCIIQCHTDTQTLGPKPQAEQARHTAKTLNNKPKLS